MTKKEETIEMPGGLTLDFFDYMEGLAKRWENPKMGIEAGNDFYDDKPNPRMAQELRSSIEHRKEQREEFIAEHKDFEIIERGET